MPRRVCHLLLELKTWRNFRFVGIEGVRPIRQCPPPPRARITRRRGDEGEREREREIKHGRSWKRWHEGTGRGGVGRYIPIYETREGYDCYTARPILGLAAATTRNCPRVRMALWLARFCRRSLPPTLKAGRKRRVATRANAAPARSRTAHPCAPLSLPKHSAFPRLFHPRRPFRRRRIILPFPPLPLVAGRGLF